MAELKPCPFCGGEARLRRVNPGYNTSPTTIRDVWEVSCDNNCCKTQRYESKIYQSPDGEVVIEKNGAKNAAYAWNRRADGGKAGSVDSGMAAGGSV